MVRPKPVIYLGPSLSVEEASSILDADYRPPVKRGDLLQLPPDINVVGIVDGVLLHDAAVGHREILGLLSKGIVVYGGGSMGALRAAELCDLGMVGVGRVFEEYRSGRVEGDDEVVLSFDPFTQQPLSEPLINIRLNLQVACDRGTITPAESARLLDEVRREFYPRRTYEVLFAKAREVLKSVDARALEDDLRRAAVDFKRNDAIMLLKAVKEHCRNP